VALNVALMAEIKSPCDLLIAHFQALQLGKQSLTCPVCGHAGWTVYERVNLPVNVEAGTGLFGVQAPYIPPYNYTPPSPYTEPQSMPVIPVVCNQCFYIMHFAYVPVTKKVSGGE
jgi:hypothetical protein